MMYRYTACSVCIVILLHFAGGVLAMALKWQSEPMITATCVDAQGKVSPEFVYFDRGWCGNMGLAGRWRTTTPPPPLGLPSPNSVVTNRPMPVPNWAYFRWFNFSQQRYFEAIIDDPSMRDRARQIARSMNEWRKYDYSLVFDFSENGIVRLWLYGIDSRRWRTPEWQFYELLGVAQGYEIDGNPNKFKNRTRSARKAGSIPMQPHPPHPATQPKRESIEDSLFPAPVLQ